MQGVAIGDGGIDIGTPGYFKLRSIPNFVSSHLYVPYTLTFHLSLFPYFMLTTERFQSIEFYEIWFLPYDILTFCPFSDTPV